MSLAVSTALNADGVLLLADEAKGFDWFSPYCDAVDPTKIIKICSKRDILPDISFSHEKEMILASSVTGEGLDKIQAKMKQIVHER